jgi:hypothetical protein
MSRQSMALSGLHTIPSQVQRARETGIDCVRYSFQARLVPTTENAGDTNLGGKPQMLDVDGFISRCAAHIANNGFFEKEIARRTEQFGRIAHVWSTYESRHNADDPKPFMRGINSIQLFYDDARWWIVSIYWQHESSEHVVPEKYL